MTREAATALAKSVESTTWYWRYNDNGDVTWTAATSPNELACAYLELAKECERLTGLVGQGIKGEHHGDTVATAGTAHPQAVDIVGREREKQGWRSGSVTDEKTARLLADTAAAYFDQSDDEEFIANFCMDIAAALRAKGRAVKERYKHRGDIVTRAAKKP